MFFPGLNITVTRARPTSNTMFSAAAIAVVSEVNPDEPGASLLSQGFKLLKPSIILGLAALTLFSGLSSKTQAAPGQHTQSALSSAVYNNTVINVTPMLFHHIDLGMSYEGVLHAVGKSPLYCDSGESACNADYGNVSTSCLEKEFIQTHKTWMCHWDGQRSRQATSSLDIWFVGTRVSQVAASLTNGDSYHRDTGNTIHLYRRPTN